MDRWLQTGTLKKKESTLTTKTAAHSIASHDEPMTNKDDNQAMHSSVCISEELSAKETIPEPAAPPQSLFEKRDRRVAVGEGPLKKKRKYEEIYLNIGFTETNDGRPLCVICGNVLTNSSMFPAKLRRHFEGKHPELKDKPSHFFKRKCNEILASQKTMTTLAKTNTEKVLEASYLVSYRVARAGEAHTIAETLIKPCTIDIVKCLFDEKAAKLVSNIPLSNNTIARRISHMADDVKETLISRIRCTKFALQMDESTDVAGLAILLVFVRYVYLQSYEEDLLLCRPLPTHTSGAEIFNLLDEFLSSNEIPWENCADICTDGAKAMMGHNIGAIAKIKEKANKCSSSHCILHRHALASRKMPSELMLVLNDAIKIINFIKSRPLKNRLFKLMCEDMGSHHQSLLMHTEVRWLSRGKALTRLMELRTEVAAFLMDHNALLATVLNDQDWVCKLAYLADIFSKMNEMNLSLQGKTTTVFDANAKVSSFKRKLMYWLECVENDDVDCFPLTKSFLNENNTKIQEKVQKNIQSHLAALKDSFEHYFPTAQEKVLDDAKWVLNVFSVNKKPPSLNSAEYEVLIDMTSHSELKIAFQNQSLPEFWLHLKDEFKILSEKAQLVMLPFSTTYLCEAGFSAYTATKTKYRNRLNAEPDIRLQLSSIEPKIGNLCTKMQPHVSH